MDSKYFYFRSLGPSGMDDGMQIQVVSEIVSHHVSKYETNEVHSKGGVVIKIYGADYDVVEKIIEDLQAHGFLSTPF